jgi:TonB family protein
MKYILSVLFILAIQLNFAQTNTDSLAIDLDKVYAKDEVDSPVRFQDGMEYFPEIRTFIQYPKDAREKGISGKVMITVVVERDGTSTNAKVTKHVYPSLDAEALRAALLIRSKMIPAEIKGIAVRSEYTFPISFYLQ